MANATTHTTDSARTVSQTAKSQGLVDVTSLVLLAVLLAAGFILNITVGNAFAMIGIKPQFIIAAYTLTVLITRATLPQALVYGLVSAAVIQFSTSIPGLNFLTEGLAAMVAALFVKTQLSVGGRDMLPLVGAFVTTLVSGALFAVLGTVLMGAALPTALAKVPVVLGTAVFNALVVQALFFPLRKVLNR